MLAFQGLKFLNFLRKQKPHIINSLSSPRGLIDVKQCKDGFIRQWVLNKFYENF